MLSITNNPTPINYPGSTWITDQMKAFVVRVKQSSLGMTPILYTGLVAPGYYESNERSNGLSYDYYLRFDADVLKPKQPFEEKLLCLQISLQVSNDTLHKLDALVGSLYVTPGGRSTAVHSLITKELIVKVSEEETKMGIYKRPGFDEAFTALIKMVPTLTPLQMAQYGGDRHNEPYNLELVEKRLYTSDEGLVTTFVKKSIQRKPTGITKVLLSVINADLERNTETLLKILS